MLLDSKKKLLNFVKVLKDECGIIISEGEIQDFVKAMNSFRRSGEDFINVIDHITEFPEEWWNCNKNGYFFFRTFRRRKVVLSPG